MKAPSLVFFNVFTPLLTAINCFFRTNRLSFSVWLIR